MLTRLSRLTPIRLPSAHPHAAGGDCAIGSSLSQALRSRPFSCVSVHRLAGRVALAFLRTVMDLAGSIPSALEAQGRLMVQPGLRALNDNVPARPFPVQVGHCRLLRVDEQSNTNGVLSTCTDSAENIHRRPRR